MILDVHTLYLLGAELVDELAVHELQLSEGQRRRVLGKFRTDTLGDGPGTGRGDFGKLAGDEEVVGAVVIRDCAVFSFK
jgi:hypothetical protein